MACLKISANLVTVVNRSELITEARFPTYLSFCSYETATFLALWLKEITP